MMPGGPIRSPYVVRRLAGDEPVAVVWRNMLGGLTFRIGIPDEERYVKWQPGAAAEFFAAEVARLRWAASFLPVPQVLESGADDEGAWLVTEGIEWGNAVDARWRQRPRMVATAIGRGLRRMHDLPVDRCPFTWSATDRVAAAQAGHHDPSMWHPEHRGLTVEQALARVAQPPPVDRLVVCHGDACAPNTLLDEHGDYAGHTDLGALGVADRWADLAVATWSLDWNFGAGIDGAGVGGADIGTAGVAGVLLAAYGVRPDPVRTAYYRLLWDLGG